jgi:hypothetical protein
MDFVVHYPVSCPWCGSRVHVTVDRSGGSQTFVEDCEVCCSPIVVHVVCDPESWELLSVAANREND